MSWHVIHDFLRGWGYHKTGTVTVLSKHVTEGFVIPFSYASEEGGKTIFASDALALLNRDIFAEPPDCDAEMERIYTELQPLLERQQAETAAANPPRFDKIILPKIRQLGGHSPLNSPHLWPPLPGPSTPHED